MAASRPFVSSDGDMYIHPRGGGIAVYSFFMEDGTPRDMTAATIYFEAGTIRKALTYGDDPENLVLTLLPADVANYKGQKLSFILRDETSAVPLVLMEGDLIVAEWT